MKTAIPSDLLKLKDQFESWRKTRSKRSKTPDHLRKAAIALLAIAFIWAFVVGQWSAVVKERELKMAIRQRAFFVLDSICCAGS